ncbi:MAG TPA: hypothetical protein VFG18_06455 [Xanthomonadaceae bacterium]|jgi:hypothetical protein|nr:hypothetical protein [Xanthomonadaceae bacterium]
MARNNDSSGSRGNNQGGRGNQGSGKQASSGGGARSQGSGSGSMSVREAGHKGGQRVSELVEKGKQRT